MKIFFLSIIATLIFASDYQLSSPNKSFNLEIYNNNGQISYSLLKNQKLIIEKSLLGMKTNKFDFSIVPRV